jgi:hypothetical protein
MEQTTLVGKLILAGHKLYRALVPPAARGKLEPLVKKMLPGISQVVIHRKKNYLEHIEVRVTEHCNLNCAYCLALSPVAQKKEMDSAVFIRDFQRLKELTGGKIGAIKILGGEPLLHPDLIYLCKTLRGLFYKTEIYIATNGVLLAKQSDEFWQTCKAYNIGISISHYPVNIHYDEIQNRARQFGIDMPPVVQPNAETMPWLKWPFDLQGKNDAAQMFNKCDNANTCVHLNEGKIYTCSVLPGLSHFNSYFNYNLQLTDKDYIDIYKARSIEEILDFTSNPPPFCAYCDVNRRSLVPWKITKKEISEWT